MNEENITVDQIEPRWFINLDWYQQNNRSFFVLARDYLCPKCRERLKADEQEASTDELLYAIKDCCSKAPGFISPKSPILCSVFRLFLANGNQPLSLAEMGKQLDEQREGDTYRTSAEMLSRLLSNDQCYGLRQAPD